MKKQRVIDDDHAALLRQQEYEAKKKGKLGQGSKSGNSIKVANTMGGNMNMGGNMGGNKKAKWQKQSEEFRAMMRANRTFQDNGTSGGGFGMSNLFFLFKIFRFQIQQYSK